MFIKYNYSIDKGRLVIINNNNQLIKKRERKTIMFNISLINLIQDSIVGVGVALILAPMVWMFVCWLDNKNKYDQMRRNIRSKIVRL